MNKNLVFIFILICLILFINKQKITENFKLPENKDKNKKKALPPGNWINSCQLLDFRPPIIWAECKNKKGVYKITSKNIRACISKNLSNIDGELHCDND